MTLLQEFYGSEMFETADAVLVEREAFDGAYPGLGVQGAGGQRSNPTRWLPKRVFAATAALALSATLQLTPRAEMAVSEPVIRLDPSAEMLKRYPLATEYHQRAARVMRSTFFGRLPPDTGEDPDYGF